MEEVDSFTATLVSSDPESAAIYKDNMPVCYTTELNVNKGELIGWEVGLTHLQFNHEWDYSTPEFKFVAWIGIAGSLESERSYTLMHNNEQFPTPLAKRLLDIAPGKVVNTETVPGRSAVVSNVNAKFVTVPARKNWVHVDELGIAVADLITDAFLSDEQHNVTVTYERSTADITRFKVNERGVGGNREFLGFSSEDSELFEILGMPPLADSSRLANPQVKLYQFTRTLYPARNGFPDLQTIFVTTNIVEEQLVGSTTAQLLKLVPLTAARNTRQREEYFTPQYVPMKPIKLRTIEIKLCDVTGELLQINNPNALVIAQLHFRKRRQEGWD